jgi:hypothetical protein
LRCVVLDCAYNNVDNSGIANPNFCNAGFANATDCGLHLIDVHGSDPDAMFDEIHAVAISGKMKFRALWDKHAIPREQLPAYTACTTQYQNGHQNALTVKFSNQEELQRLLKLKICKGCMEMGFVVVILNSVDMKLHHDKQPHGQNKGHMSAVTLLYYLATKKVQDLMRKMWAALSAETQTRVPWDAYRSFQGIKEIFRQGGVEAPDTYYLNVSTQAAGC